MNSDTDQHTSTSASRRRERGSRTRPTVEPRHWPGLWRFIAIVMLAGVAFLSLTPSPPKPPGVLHWDKAQHALTYLVLGWWCVQCWPRRSALVLVGVVAFGAGIEGLQSLSPVRMLELGDMLANGIGAVAGAALTLTVAGRFVAWLDRLLGRWTGR